jgi:hypothetical protein
MRNPHRFVLEIARDAEPIAGTLRAADGESSSFHGWLSLIAALETATGRAASTSHPEATPSHGR